MSCKHIHAHLDALLDAELDPAVERDLRAHVDGCPDCRETLAREERIRAALVELPVEGPEPGYFGRALAVARHQPAEHGRWRWWGMGFGSAVAAMLAVWLVSGTLLGPPELPPADDMPGVTIAMHQVGTVNLMFASAEALEGARLVLELPPGIELDGYAGRRELRWVTDLRAGRNVLPLKLRAIEGAGGEIVARLEHDQRQKTFRVKVTVI